MFLTLFQPPIAPFAGRPHPYASASAPSNRRDLWHSLVENHRGITVVPLCISCVVWRLGRLGRFRSRVSRKIICDAPSVPCREPFMPGLRSISLMFKRTFVSNLPLRIWKSGFPRGRLATMFVFLSRHQTAILYGDLHCGANKGAVKSVP